MKNAQGPHLLSDSSQLCLVPLCHLQLLADQLLGKGHIWEKDLIVYYVNPLEALHMNESKIPRHKFLINIGSHSLGMHRNFIIKKRLFLFLMVLINKGKGPGKRQIRQK